MNTIKFEWIIRHLNSLPFEENKREFLLGVIVGETEMEKCQEPINA